MMWTLLHIPEYETGNDRTNKSRRWLSPFTIVRVGIFLSVLFILWPLDLIGAFSSVRIRNSCVTAIQHSTCPNDDISSGRHRISTIRLSAKKKKKSDEDEDDEDDDSRQKSKGSVAKDNNQQQQQQQQKQKKSPPQNTNILEILDPYKAGKKLRKTLDTALTNLGATGLSEDRRKIYYLDDRFTDRAEPIFAERNPLFDRLLNEEDEYIPEILVVGATGEVGRLVVRRLLLDGRFRVRVLVRDLYSKTLNLLGTGVTYCQGDLSNVESLEYALTDVDKIVFCAGAPKSDEDDFLSKFEQYATDNLSHENNNEDDLDWQKAESVMKVRAQLAEQIDCNGMQNLVRAYQNVRHADYGTSQAAKRSLFKFQDRPGDFNLFAIYNQEEEDDEDDMIVPTTSNKSYNDDWKEYDTEDIYGNYGAEVSNYNDKTEDFLDEYADSYKDMEDYYDSKYEKKKQQQVVKKRRSTPTGQGSWIKNKFDHGVFVGRVPSIHAYGGAGESSIISSTLSSRDGPESGGIDLSNDFAGFVMRVCADGKNYECFIRTGEPGVEYVCQFKTGRKPKNNQTNKSMNKFTTIRVPFANFKKIHLRNKGTKNDNPHNNSRKVGSFDGKDIRQIGFRFRGDQNTNLGTTIYNNNNNNQQKKQHKWVKFYLAFSYIKVYRSQPEPEFIYLSDARIPPEIKNGMVRHDLRQLLMEEDSVTIFDEKDVERVTKNPKDRSGEEVYYKYRGEEILRHSGLSYAIIRIAGYNESPSGESSSIFLQQSDENVVPVSRADVADVVVSALLDPNASNICFYMTKKTGMKQKKIESLSKKFTGLKPEAL